MQEQHVSTPVLGPNDDTRLAQVTKAPCFRIAAIIPLYNGGEFIEAALESVLAQTRMPDEVIVVDDGSTDDGPARVEAIAQRYPLVKLLRKPNGGQSSARNFGVAHSGGELIALLDQDDLWYSNHLEVLENRFKQEHVRELGWVYSDLDRVDRSGAVVCRNLLKTALPAPHPKRTLLECLREDMFILPSASLISRRAFEAVGGFDERLCGYEDDDLFLRIYRKGYHHVFLPIALSKWRIYDTSTSYTARMTRSRIFYAAKLLKEFPDNPVANLFFARDFIAPRFIRNTAYDYADAVRKEDRAKAELTLQAMALLVPHLPARKRLLFAVAKPLLARPAIAKSVLRLRPLVRRVARMAM
jgi:glycosyltransferase involved in cell wall biosynthesis